MPIIGNEDFIDIIYKAIDNGTITDTAGFDIYAKNLSSKQRTNYRRFANAFKKRYGNRSYGTLNRGNAASNGRRDTKNRYGFSRDTASRGTSRNADEFGNEVVKKSLKSLDAPYLDAVARGDMETAERLVREAAAIAMPDTMVLDEDGLPKVCIIRPMPMFTSIVRQDRIGMSWMDIRKPASREDYNIDSSKNNAEREGGQLLILPSESSEEVGALSDLTLSSSENKGTNSVPNVQELEQKKIMLSLLRSLIIIREKIIVLYLQSYRQRMKISLYL